jgi:hypothetical protein
MASGSSCRSLLEFSLCSLFERGESVSGKGAYFEFFAKEFNHFQKNCVSVAKDQAVIDVQDEKGCFLIWLPRTEVAVVNAGISFRSFKTES